MTESASPSNSTSTAAESDGANPDDELSKPVDNMFLILRSGHKSKDGGELGSGLQEEDHPLASAPAPTEMTPEDSQFGIDSAENEFLLPEQIKKILPSSSTKSPWLDVEEKMESTVLDLNTDQDSALNRQKPPTTVTPFPSRSPSTTGGFTVDFLTPRPRGNEFVPQSPPAHELQGHEPTVWAMPNNPNYITPYEQMVSPTSEKDTIELVNFRPHFPKPFIPVRENEPPTNHNKLGKSSSTECRVGSVLINGTCKSQCDMMPNHCLNGGQCFVLEGTGVFCR